MVDILQGYGQRLLSDGFSTPFLNSPMCYMSEDLEMAKKKVADLGSAISSGQMPAKAGHIVFCFTGGMGNVSAGAQSVFACMPNHKFIR